MMHWSENVKYIKASDKGQNIVFVEKSRLDIASKR